MRWWVLAIAAGCAPVGEGGFLSELTEASVAGEAAPLGARPLRDDSLLSLTVDLGGADREWDYAIESSDPTVVAVAPINALRDLQDLDGLFETDQAVAVVTDEANDELTLAVWLAAGAPGEATLSLVDPVGGEVVEEIEVRVGRAARSVAVPAGSKRWRTVAGLPPRSVVGSVVEYDVVTLDDQGQALAGDLERVGVTAFASCEAVLSEIDSDDAAADLARCRAHNYGPGVHHLPVPGAPDVVVEVVARSDIDALAFRQHVADDGPSELLAIGIDRWGREVRGVGARWSGDPEAWGDLYLYPHDDDAAPTEVVARFDDLEVAGTVRQKEPGNVRLSDDVSSCSSTGGAPGGAAGSLAASIALALGARRRGAIRTS